MNTEILKNIFIDNKAKYCEVFGCRNRYWDKRFCDNPYAVEARELLMELKKGESMLSLAKEIGVSSSTISRVVGGNAGSIPRSEYNGLSTTEYIMNSLREMVRSRQGV